MDTITFGPWPAELHDQPDQKKRQESALDKKLTPLKVDFTEKSGVFHGSSTSQYRTTLYNCECGDFRRRKAPCKHMYRLSMELMVIPGIDKAESVNPKVLTARDNDVFLSVEDVLRIIADLPEKDQLAFAYICYQCGNENKNGPFESNGPLTEWLISKGLLVRDESAKNSLRYMKKGDIVRLYGEKCPIDSKMKKDEIIEVVSTVISWEDIPEEYRRGLVWLDPKIDRDAIKIHRRICKLYPQSKETVVFL